MRLKYLGKEIKITNEHIKDIIYSDAFERLRGIKQNGYRGIRENINYSRADHSLNVAFLTAYFGGTNEDIIGALLHDIFHTNFSHVIDYVVGDSSVSFHEKNKSAFINSDLMKPVRKILGEFIDAGSYLKTVDSFFDEDNFPIVKNNKELATDVLSYTIDDSIYSDLVSEKNVVRVLDGIGSFRDRDKTYLYCLDSTVAMFLIGMSFNANLHLYCAPWNHAENYLFAEDLKGAIEKGDLKFKKLLGGTKGDIELIERVELSSELERFERTNYKFESEIKNMSLFELLVDVRVNRVRVVNPKIGSDSVKFISDYPEGTKEFDFYKVLVEKTKKISQNVKIYHRKKN